MKSRRSARARSAHVADGAMVGLEPEAEAVTDYLRALGPSVPRDPAFTARLRVELMLAHRRRPRLRARLARLALASWRPILVAATLLFGGGIAAARVLPRPPATGPAVRTVPVGQDPSAIALDERSGHAFVIDGGSPTGAGNVSMLDMGSGALVRNIAVGPAPISLAIDRRAGRVFVVNSAMHAATPSVSVLDTRSGHVLRTTPMVNAPYAVAVDESAGRAFVLNAGTQANIRGAVSVLDNRSGRLVRTVYAGTNGGPMLGPQVLAVDTRRRRLLVVTGGVIDYQPGTMLSILDTRSGKVIATPRVGPSPFGMAVDERTGRAFVAGNGGLSVLDTADGRVLRRGGGATGGPIVVDARRGRVFVGDRGGVRALDARTGVALWTRAVRPDAAPLAVDERSGRVIVATIGPTTGSDIPTRDGIVRVLDGATGAVLGAVIVGRMPYAAAVDGRTGRVFVLNQFSNTVSVLEP